MPPMSLLSMAQVSSLTGKTVLFVYGGWKGHEPEQCRDIFVTEALEIMKRGICWAVR